MSKPVTTRFAVSPTGFMHIGGARTALFSYLWARKNNGTFILRIEDTDKKREVEGAVKHILESLSWLGIEWDYGPDKPHSEWGSATQSERLDVYKKYAERLIDKGLAYPDPYSQEELAAFRTLAEQEKRPFLYRNHRPDSFEDWDGTKPLRLKVPEVKRYRWYDEVRGELSGGEEMLDDIVIIKSDGFPTYNFCHIIDDYIMGVTHVMRSDEFIASTPRFLSIHDALEIPHPKFVSLPPIMGPTGKKKLSKRDGAKDVLDYRSEGYLPETLVNFLALIGWNPGGEKELFTKTELIEAFSLEGIQRSGGAFNQTKLQWMNREYLGNLDTETFLQMVKNALSERVTSLPDYTEERLGRLLPTIRERVHTALEVTEAAEAGEYDFAFTHPVVTPELITFKNDSGPEDALPRLIRLSELLETASFESPDTIKAAVWDYAEAEGRGEVLWPMRTALTGLERSPDPFTCAYVIGKEHTLVRLKNACDKIKE